MNNAQLVTETIKHIINRIKKDNGYILSGIIHAMVHGHLIHYSLDWNSQLALLFKYLFAEICPSEWSELTHKNEIPETQTFDNFLMNASIIHLSYQINI